MKKQYIYPKEIEEKEIKKEKNLKRINIEKKWNEYKETCNYYPELNLKKLKPKEENINNNNLEYVISTESIIIDKDNKFDNNIEVDNIKDLENKLNSLT